MGLFDRHDCFEFLLFLGLDNALIHCPVNGIQSRRKAACVRFSYPLTATDNVRPFGFVSARVLAHKADGAAADHDLIAAFGT